MAMQNETFDSIFWDRFDDIIIRDIGIKHRERIIKFMIEQYFRVHPFYGVLQLYEEPDIEEEYKKYLMHILKDESSIAAVDKHTGQILAVGILKCMSKKWRSWTSYRLVTTSEKLNDMLKLRRKMVFDFALKNTQHTFDALDITDYYIDKDLRGNMDFLERFFNVICEVARHMRLPRVTFLAWTIDEQIHAFNNSFEELSRVIYSMYVKDRMRPFAVLRDLDEMYAALCERPVEPLVSYIDMPPPGEKLVPRILELHGLPSIIPKTSVLAI